MKQSKQKHTEKQNSFAKLRYKKRNRKKKQNSFAKLKLSSGPAEIVSKPVPKRVKQGSNATLTCEAKGAFLILYILINI